MDSSFFLTYGFLIYSLGLSFPTGSLTTVILGSGEISSLWKEPSAKRKDPWTPSCFGFSLEYVRASLDMVEIQNISPRQDILLTHLAFCICGLHIHRFAKHNKKYLFLKILYPRMYLHYIYNCMKYCRKFRDTRKSRVNPPPFNKENLSTLRFW